MRVVVTSTFRGWEVTWLERGKWKVGGGTERRGKTSCTPSIFQRPRTAPKAIPFYSIGLQAFCSQVAPLTFRILPLSGRERIPSYFMNVHWKLLCVIDFLLHRGATKSYTKWRPPWATNCSLLGLGNYKSCTGLRASIKL